MRILLAKCFRPFETAPADQIASELVRAVKEIGHQCELIQIPETDPENLNQLMKTLEIENTDRLVSLDSASHEIRHKAKILVQLIPDSREAPFHPQVLDQPGVIRVFLPAGRMNSGPQSSLVTGGKVELFANIGELARAIVS